MFIRWTLVVLLCLLLKNSSAAKSKDKVRVRTKSTDIAKSHFGNSLNNKFGDKSTEEHENRLAHVSFNSSGAFTEWSLSTEASESVATDESQVPPMPLSLKVRPTAKSIEVTWTSPSNSPIIVRGYTIGWGIGFPDVSTQIVDARTRSYTIEDLRFSSEYVISLRAFNNLGDGQPIYETTMTLVEDEPSPLPILPPVGLKVEVLSSTSVILHWTDTTLPARSQTPSDGRYYTVKYSSNFHTTNPKYKYVNATSLNAMIDDLKPNTQYEFAVKIVKGRRESTWSMSTLNTTQETSPSSPPRDLSIVPEEDDPSTIYLHWQPPKQPNGRITGYVIFYTADNSQQDRDWVIEAVIGDKLSTTLKDLAPDTQYYFKIQARNQKGYGPISQEVNYRTNLPKYPRSYSASDGKALSAQTLYVVISGISLVTVLLLLVVSILLCKSKNSTRKQGYTAAATSPRTKGPKPAKSNRSGDINPPDLWIHHHEQMELKNLNDSGKSNGSNAAHKDTNSLLGETRIYHDSPDEANLIIDSRKGPYISDSLYDDVAKGPSSPTIDLAPPIGGYSTNTAGRRTVRAKPMPVMIPVESSPGLGCTQMGANNFEPSTGLSRPVYPRPQLNTLGRAGHASLAMDLNSDTHPHHFTHHNIMPHHNISNTQGAGNHNLYDPVAGSLSSHNVSYGAGDGILMSSPSSNTLSKRLTATASSLKSFSVPTAPMVKHSIAVRPQLIQSASPMRKSPTFGKPPISQIVNPSSKFLKDDDQMSTYSTEELNQEMANLEGIMKDLNAITASEFEMAN